MPSFHLLGSKGLEMEGTEVGKDEGRGCFEWGRASERS